MNGLIITNSNTKKASMIALITKTRNYKLACELFKERRDQTFRQTEARVIGKYVNRPH